MAENKPAGERKPHRYLSAGDTDRREMLDAIGLSEVEALFASLPETIRLGRPLDIAGPLSDQELRQYFQRLDAANRIPGRELISFLGGGAYRHDVPAVVDQLLMRGEYLTVYTPYQPEVSQGTLQSIFEFQTFISMLTGLPVANASLYEGASAFAEAVLMADRLQKKRRRVVMARSVHPQYRQTLRTYVQNLELELVEVGWNPAGQVNLDELEAALDAETICVAVQSPNYFGVIEPWERISGPAHTVGALTVGVVAEALSLALLQSPGDGGCDIAAGEAQSLGLPLGFGGPYLGFLSTREEHKRALPGRLVGQTVDADGKRAWVLTLATREQHIRREKATSNICTNQALCALASTIYLSLYGKRGLRRLAEINLQRAASLRRRMVEEGGIMRPRFEAPSFNEFTVSSSEPVAELLQAFEKEGILAGIPLGTDYPELADSVLVAVTECNPPAELERFVAVASKMTALASPAAG